ncbi:hypothetical protein LTR37_015083 [Vermiconidia calcicola]|uniref:Uncharacterized protein n=1 Tax=Vermiconidia calcicola TaxID=1690605 RepID=A0ACC3MUG1_9PEZI|nr:hypothetical protein LTR37_015083 [Vermiconidia calcicola]
MAHTQICHRCTTIGNYMCDSATKTPCASCSIASSERRRTVQCTPTRTTIAEWFLSQGREPPPPPSLAMPLQPSAQIHLSQAQFYQLLDLQQLFMLFMDTADIFSQQPFQSQSYPQLNPPSNFLQQMPGPMQFYTQPPPFQQPYLQPFYPQQPYLNFPYHSYPLDGAADGGYPAQTLPSIPQRPAMQTTAGGTREDRINNVLDSTWNTYQQNALLAPIAPSESYVQGQKEAHRQTSRPNKRQCIEDISDQPRKKGKSNTGGPGAISDDEQTSELTAPQVRRNDVPKISSDDAAKEAIHDNEPGRDAEASVVSPPTSRRQQSMELTPDTTTESGHVAEQGCGSDQDTSGVATSQRKVSGSDHVEAERRKKHRVDTVVAALRDKDMEDRLEMLEGLGLTSEGQIMVLAALQGSSPL